MSQIPTQKATDIKEQKDLNPDPSTNENSKFIKVVFINNSKSGIDDQICKIPKEWTAKKICWFYSKFHKSTAIQTSDSDINFIIHGRTFKDDHVLKDFLPENHKTNESDELKIFVMLVAPQKKTPSTDKNDPEKIIHSNRIFKLLKDYTEFAKKCTDYDKMSLSEFISSHFPFMNTNIDMLLNSCVETDLNNIQPEFRTKEVLEIFRLSGKCFNIFGTKYNSVDKKNSVSARSIENHPNLYEGSLEEEMKKTSQIMNNDGLSTKSIVNNKMDMNPNPEFPMQEVKVDGSDLNLKQNQDPNPNSERNLSERANSGRRNVSNRAITDNGNNNQNVENNAPNQENIVNNPDDQNQQNVEVNAENPEGNENIDLFTFIWLVIIIGVVFLLLYFNKYDQLILLTVTLFLRMLENDILLDNVRNTDLEIQIQLEGRPNPNENNPNNENPQTAVQNEDPENQKVYEVQFENYYIGCFIKILEFFVCQITSMLPSFTSERYVKLIYHNYMKNFFKKILKMPEVIVIENDDEKNEEQSYILEEKEKSETKNIQETEKPMNNQEIQLETMLLEDNKKTESKLEIAELEKHLQETKGTEGIQEITELEKHQNLVQVPKSLVSRSGILDIKDEILENSEIPKINEQLYENSKSLDEKLTKSQEKEQKRENTQPIEQKIENLQVSEEKFDIKNEKTRNSSYMCYEPVDEEFLCIRERCLEEKEVPKSINNIDAKKNCSITSIYNDKTPEKQNQINCDFKNNSLPKSNNSATSKTEIVQGKSTINLDENVKASFLKNTLLSDSKAGSTRTTNRISDLEWENRISDLNSARK